MEIRPEEIKSIIEHPYDEISKLKILDEDLKNSISILVKSIKSNEEKMFEQYEIIDMNDLPEPCKEHF
jgi:hypothetical protein